MNDRKNSFELSRIGKEERPCLKLRLLLEDFSLSYRATQRITEAEIVDDMRFPSDPVLASIAGSETAGLTSHQSTSSRRRCSEMDGGEKS